MSSHILSYSAMLALLIYPVRVARGSAGGDSFVAPQVVFQDLFLVAGEKQPELFLDFFAAILVWPLYHQLYNAPCFAAISMVRDHLHIPSGHVASTVMPSILRDGRAMAFY